MASIALLRLQNNEPLTLSLSHSLTILLDKSTIVVVDSI
jgi:hypothetical protein